MEALGDGDTGKVPPAGGVSLPPEGEAELQSERQGPFGFQLPPPSSGQSGDAKKSVSRTSILKLKITRPKAGASKRRPDTAPNLHIQNVASLDSYRSPWVHAPGKSTLVPGSPSTTTTSRRIPQSVLLAEESFNNGTSSSSIRSHHNFIEDPNSKLKKAMSMSSNKPSSVASRIAVFGGKGSSRKGGGVKKKLRKIRATGYTLKTKDSLVDVTAFLQAKREAIMKLWEEHLPNGDTSLVSQFEKANTLALEAAKEVDHLRQSIQNLHQKESSLSEGDCETLDRLRTQVLSKVKAFEEVNTQVHIMISNTKLLSTSKELLLDKSTSTLIAPSERIARPKTASRSGSGRTNHSIGRGSGQDEVIFLKEKSPYFQGQYDSEPEGYFIGIQGQSPPKGISSTNTNASASAKTSSTADLNTLTRLYAETYDLPPFDGSPHSPRDTDALSHQPKGRVRFKEGRSEEVKSQDDRFGKVKGQSQGKSYLYQEKVEEVQRKLMETEAEVEELKGDLERVESESNFQVRMLRSSLKDRIETLEVFPEYLQMTEKRLIETLQVKVQLERTLGERDREVSNLREREENVRRELEEFKEKCRKYESSKDFMAQRMTDLEKSNDALRKEVEEKKSEISQVTGKLQGRSMASLYINKEVQGQDERTNVRELSVENQKLELKQMDLKDRLAKAHNDIHILHISKKKLSVRLTRRQEEILEELEEARSRNRLLQSQIHYIRSTYHDLFPIELFNPKKSTITMNKKAAEKMGGQRSERLIRSKPKDSRSMISLNDEPPGVDEPEITKTYTWETGLDLLETDDENGNELLAYNED